MSLEIVDTELDDLAREVAEATGESVADAVKESLRERLGRLKPAEEPRPALDEAERERRVEAMLEFGRRWREAPVVDPRSLDEIMDYDQNGVPR